MADVIVIKPVVISILVIKFKYPNAYHYMKDEKKIIYIYVKFILWSSFPKSRLY